MAPLSRGNVTIRSWDAKVTPVINPNACNSSTDRQVAVAAFKRIRQMAQTPELAEVLVEGEYFPGYSVQSDEEILAFLEDSAMAYYHAGGSCAMGDVSKKNGNAVVDSQARVIGVQGLRVVDAS